MNLPQPPFRHGPGRPPTTRSIIALSTSYPDPMKSNRELLLQLGHRARACPGFRWLPGMGAFEERVDLCHAASISA